MAWLDSTPPPKRRPPPRTFTITLDTEEAEAMAAVLRRHARGQFLIPRSQGNEHLEDALCRDLAR